MIYQYNVNNNVNTSKINRSEFILNVLVISMFVLNICLLFLITNIVFFQSLAQIEGGSGFVLLPFLAAKCCIPQLIGMILSVINCFIKKLWMSIVIFIFSFLSLGANIWAINITGGSVLFWICIIQCIVLLVVCFLKLILKNKN